MYRDGQKLGTTLEVRPTDWPATFSAFEEYWRERVAEIEMSPAVHEGMTELANLDVLSIRLGIAGTVIHKVIGPAHQAVTVMMLPAEFRQTMGWDWTAEQQRRFERCLEVLRPIDRLLRPVTQLSYQAYLLDFRWRRRRRKTYLGTLTLASHPILEQDLTAGLYEASLPSCPHAMTNSVRFG
jgi:uncharacterized protein (DUF2236 family)